MLASGFALASLALCLPRVAAADEIAALASGERAAPRPAARFSAIVVDAATGEPLHETDADQPRYPASLTKMMTLYLLFQRLAAAEVTFDTSFRVSQHAASMQPTKLNLVPGSSVRVEDLMFGLITRSANDAAVVLAEGLAGSEPAFARAMTEAAHRLGMTQSQFRNASGLPDPEQVSTARDMAALGRALIRDFPDYYRFFDTRSFTYKGEVVENHNRMLGAYDGLDGIKTGFIHASGFNLVASAKRNGRRLIGVIFGGSNAWSRNQQMAQLLDASFANQEWAPVLRLVNRSNPETLGKTGNPELPQRVSAAARSAEARQPDRSAPAAKARAQAAAAAGRSFLGDLQATAALRQILDERATPLFTGLGK